MLVEQKAPGRHEDGPTLNRRPSGPARGAMRTAPSALRNYLAGPLVRLVQWLQSSPLGKGLHIPAVRNHAPGARAPPELRLMAVPARERMEPCTRAG